MAAGQGFKTFTTGEVLTAGDVNGYLMQGVLVFASAAARNAAITSPQEGQFAFTKDTNGLWYYDGAAWVASGATGDIEGVTAGVGISGGGTSGTVTITNDMATTITASGDIVVGTGSGTYDNLPIGTTGQVLTADTTVSPYKVKWAAAGGGDNGPSFSAYRSGSNQSITNSTFVKAQLNAEEWDTASAYDSSTNYRFTPQTAGYYNVVVSGYVNYASADTINLFIYKNGSSYKYIAANNKANGGGTTAYGGACMVYFNGSTDYIELYLYSYNTTTEIPVNILNCSFSAALVRTA
jgi:hypothetical protein